MSMLRLSVYINVQNDNHNNNAQIAAIALPPSTIHSQLLADLLTLYKFNVHTFNILSATHTQTHAYTHNSIS